LPDKDGSSSFRAPGGDYTGLGKSRYLEKKEEILRKLLPGSN
jgi:hypothetical protein